MNNNNNKNKDFSEFTSKSLPPVKELNLSQEDWLHVYWKKLGEERGKALTDSDKAWNIPKISDPLEWSDTAWESWLD
jgi:hypothetical protein